MHRVYKILISVPSTTHADREPIRTGEIIQLVNDLLYKCGLKFGLPEPTCNGYLLLYQGNSKHHLGDKPLDVCKKGLMLVLLVEEERFTLNMGGAILGSQTKKRRDPAEHPR